MRCAVCEEPLDVLDCCETCQTARKPPPIRTISLRFTDRDTDPGKCDLGHERFWTGKRWRCRACNQRYRLTRNMKLRMETAARRRAE